MPSNKLALWAESAGGALQIAGALLLSPQLRSWQNRWGATSVDFVMGRNMLRTLKALAERSGAP